MAKTSALTTLSPKKLSLGSPVVAEDALAVVELANWVFVNRPQMHVSMVCGPQGWSTNSAGTLATYFRITGESFCQLLRFRIWVLPETTDIVVGARCWFDTGESGTVRFEVGSETADIAFDDGDNGNEVSGVVDGPGVAGWQTVKIWLRRDVGSTARSAYLYSLRIQDAPQSVLPDPEDS